LLNILNLEEKNEIPEELRILKLSPRIIFRFHEMDKNVLIKKYLLIIHFSVDLSVDLIFFKESVNVTAEIHKYE